jgi:hypothetical protein
MIKALSKLDVITLFVEDLPESRRFTPTSSASR